jgi:CubicO group peptidase (beta-lactamase class C family)
VFNVAKPESVGISSKEVAKFIKTLERRGLVTHSVLLMRGNTIFSECYWKPFDEKFCHRMYSETKNFVSVAIGLLEEDGIISLDDKIVDYFPEKIDGEISDYLKN